MYFITLNIIILAVKMKVFFAIVMPDNALNIEVLPKNTLTSNIFLAKSLIFNYNKRISKLSLRGIVWKKEKPILSSS